MNGSLKFAPNVKVWAMMGLNVSRIELSRSGGL